MMKVPAGVIVIASILFISGFRLVGGAAESYSHLAVRLTQVLVGVLGLVAAENFWSSRRYAMKAYWAWVAGGLLSGGILQLAIDNTPLLHVVIWWVFAGAVWVAVGVYLRSATARTA